MTKKKRRYIKRKRLKIVPLSELKETANSMGMTTKEYVDRLAQQNRDHTGKRNRSAFLDLGPVPIKLRKEKDDDA